MIESLPEPRNWRFAPVSDSHLDTLHLRQCVQRWQDGDRLAAENLLEVTGKRLEHLARKMLRSFPNLRGWADTPDVLQGALLRLLNSLRNVQPASTRHFFNLAAVHIRRELIDLARDIARSVRGANDSPEGAPNVEQIADDKGQPPDDLESWCRFHEAVERLPNEEREVVSLVFYHGWKQAQIAELFGVDERTIRRRWQQACQKLNRMVGDDLPQP